MKTTIEVEGYEITIDTTAEAISVCAMKDDDVVEEFTLALGEGGEELPEDDDEVQGFDEFSEEEGDFEGSDEDSEDDDLEEAEDDVEGVEDDEDSEDAEEKVKDEEPKLESFQSFFNKRKKK